MYNAICRKAMGKRLHQPWSAAATAPGIGVHFNIEGHIHNGRFYNLSRSSKTGQANVL